MPPAGLALIESPPETLAEQQVMALPAVAVVAVAEHLEEFAALEPDGLVFPSGGGTYLQRSNFRRLVCAPAVQQSGLDGLWFQRPVAQRCDPGCRHWATIVESTIHGAVSEAMARMACGLQDRRGATRHR